MQTYGEAGLLRFALRKEHILCRTFLDEHLLNIYNICGDLELLKKENPNE